MNKPTAMMAALVLAAIASQTKAETGVLQTSPIPLSQAARNTVFITDPTVLRDSGVNLTFRRTLRKILATIQQDPNAPAVSLNAENTEKFLGTMISSFSATSALNRGVRMPLTLRLGESRLQPSALLDPQDLVDGMRLIAVANRFDLAPADFSTCGEARLVYAKGAPASITNRMTIIFEAAVPNPNPSAGAPGCLPITQFWAQLANQSGVQLAQSIESLFFVGLPSSGVAPIVSANNFGNPLGQVRVNLFVNSQQWQLRQFDIRKAVTHGIVTGARFRMRPVTDNAWPTLYKDPVPGEPLDYLVRRVSELLSLDRNAHATSGTLTDTQLINGMGSRVPRRFSSFESNGSGIGILPTTEFPDSIASRSFREKISTALSAIPLLWSVNSSNVLNRDGAGTCIGCHSSAGGSPLAPLTNAPLLKSSGSVLFPRVPFVHVDENGTMSAFLTNHALPQRASILRSFNESGGLMAKNAAGQTVILNSTTTTMGITASIVPTNLSDEQTDDFRDDFQTRQRAFGITTSH
jgi:hypothetical protein